MNNSTEKTNPTKTRLIPLTDCSKFHAWPPLGGLRHLVFHSESNGFNQVVKRVSKRVLIDEEAFFRWVNDNNPQVHGKSNGKDLCTTFLKNFK